MPTMKTRGMRQAIHRILDHATERVFGWLALYVLRPAADWLPRTTARTLAQGVGWLMAVSPTRGRTAYATMRRAFGRPRVGALAGAQQLLARPLLDFVILRRMIRGREDWNRWKVVETGSEEARRLRDSGESFILVTGHFARESFFALFLQAVLPQRIGMVAAPMPPLSADPAAARMRLQYGQIIDAMPCMRPEDLECLFTGGFSARLDKRLSKRGNVVAISVDAYWMGGGHYGPGRTAQQAEHTSGMHHCPFAGFQEYRVSTGAASLARLTQRPIVPCSTYMQGKTAVIEWGTPILAPAPKDKEADTRITEELLRFVERAVGERPGQYVLDIGRDRRWDAESHSWKDRG